MAASRVVQFGVGSRLIRVVVRTDPASVATMWFLVGLTVGALLTVLVAG